MSVTGVSKAVEHINSAIAPALVDQVRKFSSLSLLPSRFCHKLHFWLFSSCNANVNISELVISNHFRMYPWSSKRRLTKWWLTWTAQRTNASDDKRAAGTCYSITTVYSAKKTVTSYLCCSEKLEWKLFWANLTVVTVFFTCWKELQQVSTNLQQNDCEANITGVRTK